jgi:hypothetical protein
MLPAQFALELTITNVPNALVPTFYKEVYVQLHAALETSKIPKPKLVIAVNLVAVFVPHPLLVVHVQLEMFYKMDSV